MFTAALHNIPELSMHPASLFALGGVLLLIFLFLYIRRIRFTPAMLVYIGLMLALTILLHQLRLYHMPQGGSITCGAMIPLLLIAYRYGSGIGCLTGFLYGLINLLQDPYVLHPVQVLFDYPLPYMALGLAAFWPSRRWLSTLLAFCGRFCCHVISGIIFFGSYAPAGTSPVLYALTFNAAYLVPEFIICFAILRILPVERLLAAMDRSDMRCD
jgi:thiamine transporter